jgi:serine phosphatase RsbU (regulator of sigma subunit)/putative methionine-R-sulfoxide reductase with GAF domain
LELDELFRQTVYLIRENFDYYHVALFTANSEEQIVTFETGAGEQNLAFDVEWGEGLIGWVAAHGQSVIVNDVENDTRYRCLAALEGTQSELAVPLLLVLSRDVLSTPHQGRSGSEENELVGVLDVQSDQPNAFGPDDLFILETLGDQIAIAIQQARLYEAERQQAWLSTALLKIADSMSHLSDMDSVLAAIVRLTPILAGVDRCAILLWDPDLEAFVPGETHGLKPELRDTFENTWFSPDTVPALERIYDDKVPVIVNAVDDQELIPRDMAETFLIEEMALLPLLAQGELLGVMMVDYAGRPHHFGKRTTDMLTGIANQAAMVIQSARLVRAQQEEAYVSMALLQVADGINRANDLQEALETVVRITPVLAGVEACVVFLWDPDSAAFVPYEQYGLRPEAQPAFWELRFPEEHPLTQELMAGKPFIPIHDLMEHPAHPEMWGTGSLLAFPLVSKGEILGMMSIDYDIPGDQISQRWMSILTGISGQAALAIENDRLLQEAAEQERMKQELDVARRIQTSFLPERWLDIPGWELATVWRSAREVSGDFYDFIPLPPVNGAVDQRMGLVIADVADKGVPAALFMALSRTLVRTVAIDGRPPSRAIARANDLIQSDARSELFVTLFYAILQPDSEEIAFVNAGHVPPLLVRIKDGTTEELMTGDMALGVLPDLEFAGHKTHLAPGDTLVLYTDGVIEASNPQQQMFGRERLIELVKANRTQSAEELAQTIDEVVTAFAGDAPQYDDFTLVVAKRH